MTDDFNTSTEVVLQRLGVSYKTLARRRTDIQDRRTAKQLQFLEPGVHFRRKSPESTRLVWNWPRTERAWNQAMKIAAAQQEAA
jgi:hypothetical protein